MEELYIEGVATHSGPESCVVVCKGAAKRRQGHVQAGLSSHKMCNSGCPRCRNARRQHPERRYREAASSKNHGMYGTSMRENREIPRPPVRVISGWDAQGMRGGNPASGVRCPLLRTRSGAYLESRGLASAMSKRTDRPSPGANGQAPIVERASTTEFPCRCRDGFVCGRRNLTAHVAAAAQPRHPETRVRARRTAPHSHCPWNTSHKRGYVPARRRIAHPARLVKSLNISNATAPAKPASSMMFAAWYHADTERVLPEGSAGTCRAAVHH